MINISYNFDNDWLKSILKDDILDFAIAAVAWNLANSICSKIFNYNSLVSSIDIGKLIADPNSTPCSCAELLLIDKDHVYF